MARYELVEGVSSKFWEIELEGASFTTRWGRIGTSGQSTTKEFPSEAAAKKEHDKLVAEKVKKGYKLVGESAGSDRPEKGTPASPASAASNPVRQDLDVYNEATGFMVFSRSLAGRDLTEAEQGGAKWSEAVRDGVFLPIELVQDDPILVRVVVDDLLDAQEQEEWVDRLDAALQVPDGKLCVMGGGAEFLEDPEGDHSEYLRVVDVPAGNYRATIYTYLQGVNGDYCLDAPTKGDKEPSRTWFERTRPKTKIPDWITVESAMKRKTEYVHFLVHLERLDAGEKPKNRAKLDKEGWFPPSVAPRKPERCPLGVVAKEPVQRRDPDAKPREAAKPKAIEGVEVCSRVQDRPLERIEGGPLVLQPKRDLARLYQLAWFASDAAQPEIVLRTPETVFYEAPDSSPAFQVVEVGSGEIRIRLAPCDKWTLLVETASAGGSLGIIPRKSMLELVTASDRDGTSGERPRGLLRFRGEVEDWMTWKVSEAYPKVDKNTLEAALALQKEAALGKQITARSEAEAEAILVRARAELDAKSAARLARDGARVVLAKPNVQLLQVVGACAFRVMFGSIWS